MNSKQFAERMILDVQEREAAGQSSILCSALVSYLNTHISEPQEEANPEIEKLRHEASMKNWIAQQDRAHAENLEMFRSVITSGQSALKTGFLLNGGASVAMLAYIGEHGGEHTAAFSYGLMWFVWGTLMITISNAFTYFTQRAYAAYGELAWVKRLNEFTIAAGVSSLGFFIVGMYSVYKVLLTI